MIKTYFSKYKRSIFGGQFFKLIEAILELFIPLIVAKIIDKGIVDKSVPYVLKMGFYMFILGVVGFICACVCQYLAAYTSEKIGQDIRYEIYNKIRKLSYKQIDDCNKDSLLIRMTLDVERIQILVAMYIRLFVRAPFILIGAFIMCFMINMKLSIIILGVLISLTVLVVLLYRVIPGKVLKIQLLTDKFTLLIRESILGNKVIRGFNYQYDTAEKFDVQNREIRLENYSLGKTMGIFDPVVNLTLYSAFILILFIGAKLVDKGELLRGDVVAYTGYLSSIITMWVIATKLVSILFNGLASINRIESFIDIDTDIKENYTYKPEHDKIAVKVNNLMFSYENNEHYVLKNINIELEDGMCYGIIGGTGSGKSTLINVLNRSYKIDHGNIMIYGVDINNYSNNDLRKCFSIANQRGKLFSASIFENLLWGDEFSSREKAVKILKKSGLEEFVYDKGLDFSLTDGGDNISGGQRQRMIIARTLMKDESDIFIFDDSFSALDTKTEAKVLQNIIDMNKLTIIVSQRVSSIKRCDKIIVMDSGSIIDVGNHNELFERCDIYKEIVESQNIDEDSN